MSSFVSATPLCGLLAAVILGTPAFCSSLLPNGQYYANVNFAPPCCVLSSIAQSTSGNQPAYGSRSASGSSWSYDGSGSAEAMVGWASGQLPLALESFVLTSS